MVFFDQLIDCYFFQIIILGEVGDPGAKASIAVDDVLFENNFCDELPPGKFNIILFHSFVFFSVNIWSSTVRCPMVHSCNM